jgi:hypothetical protein
MMENGYLERCLKRLTRIRYAIHHHNRSLHEILTSGSVLQLLTDSKNRDRILDIFLKDPDTVSADVRKRNYRTEILLRRNQGGKVRLRLVHRLDFMGLVYLDMHEMLRNCITDSNGIKWLSPAYHFEEVILYHRVRVETLPDRFRQYFSSLDEETRNAIFRHITGKYRVNINVIEDLYKHHSRFSRKILQIAEARPENKGWLMLRNKLCLLTDRWKSSLQKFGVQKYDYTLQPSPIHKN